VTNVERLLHLRRAREELAQVAGELPGDVLACPNCRGEVSVDPEAAELLSGISKIRAVLDEWIARIELRPARSDRITPAR
jgi:hypothetical protein